MQLPFSAADHDFMARALQLGARGLFSTTPNPRVGCVIARDGVIVGEGWHRRAGDAHAEVLALGAAGERARGATVYVSLEPCTHHGRTPPCVDSLVTAGVRHLVAAMRDPNPLVAGEGLARLREAGVEVAVGLLEEEARELNIGFVSRMTRDRPWLRLKVAASLDGKTALADGQSQWITSPEARLDGHRWRARACAILTGIGTVKDDDPRLSVRGVDTVRQPQRIVVDSRLELPLTARVLQGAGVQAKVLVAAATADRTRIRAVEDCGAEVLLLPNPRGKVDLPALLQELARRGINEIHAEAGFKLNGSLLREDCVDELLVYLAPCLVGEGQGMFDLAALTSLEHRRRLRVRELRAVGEDYRLLARFADVETQVVGLQPPQRADDPAAA